MATRDEILNLLAAGPASTSELAARLGVTRQAIHQQLTTLEERGEVQRSGKARATRWSRRYEHLFSWPLRSPDGSVPAEHEMWAEAWGVIQANLPGRSPAAQSALEYGATEVLNNAIDHSGGQVVTLSVRRQSTNLELVIADDGVGALAHIQRRFRLPSPLDAIAHIAKGRQPTDPARHSGEGLFFTSKIFDYFELDANGHAWKVDNLRQDMTVAPGVAPKGTRVTLRIDLNTTRSPRKVFELYTDPNSFAVTSNRLRVSLADHSTNFVSRSEAKRLAMGLELYDRVELDFTGVAEVGQGFVDELFRVWAGANPGTVLVPIHMSPEVAFMVNRGLGEALG